MPNSARPMRLGLLFHAILLIGITANVEANTPPVMLTSPKDFLCTRQISQNPYPIRILPS